MTLGERGRLGVRPAWPPPASRFSGEKIGPCSLRKDIFLYLYIFFGVFFWCCGRLGLGGLAAGRGGDAGGRGRGGQTRWRGCPRAGDRPGLPRPNGEKQQLSKSSAAPENAHGGGGGGGRRDLWKFLSLGSLVGFRSHVHGHFLAAPPPPDLVPLFSPPTPPIPDLLVCLFFTSPSVLLIRQVFFFF